FFFFELEVAAVTNGENIAPLAHLQELVGADAELRGGFVYFEQFGHEWRLQEQLCAPQPCAVGATFYLCPSSERISPGDGVLPLNSSICKSQWTLRTLLSAISPVTGSR